MTPSRPTPKRTNDGFCKFTVKFGSRTANDVNFDGNRQQQPPPESKRRKLELARDKSCSAPEAEEVAAASLPTMHDLDETREKLMYDLRNSIMAHEIFSREEELREEHIPAAAETTAAAFVARRSNILSIRISATAAAAAENKIPVVKGSPNGLQIDGRKRGRSSSSPPARDDVVAVNVWERRTRGSSNRKKERARFSLSLTTVEVEEDFMKLIGRRRPERRQKKRSKNLQQRLEDLFPGNGLTEVTADLYKVPGSKANEKND